MYKTIEFIKKSNKGFKYYLFDDVDCRNFIERNFNPDVLNAYDSLIPGAYKADLWRYCVLYIHGGIYLDIKYIPVHGFKFIHLLEQEHFPLDLNKNNIYNALLVCKPKNEILLSAINRIVDNVKNKYYGKGILEPTGPALLANLIASEDKQNAKIHHSVLGSNDHDKLLKYKDKVILRCYPGYFIERQKYSKIQHYSDLWHQRKIYK
jgi:mannosyltransferase OCH1-like enzyme